MQVKVMGWQGGVHLSEECATERWFPPVRGGMRWILLHPVSLPASGNHHYCFTTFILSLYFLPSYRLSDNLKKMDPTLPVRRHRAKARWFPPVRGGDAVDFRIAQ
jgi:hypothetical protein